MGRAGKALTPAEQERLINLRKSGWSVKAVAEEMDINPKTVGTYYKSKRNLTQADKDEILSLRGEGWPIKDIAAKLGIGVQTVSAHSGRFKKPTPAVVTGRAEDFDPRPIIGSEYPEPVPYVPRYPDDLPDLEMDAFQWTQEELDDATQEAKRRLFSTYPASYWLAKDKEDAR